MSVKAADIFTTECALFYRIFFIIDDVEPNVSSEFLIGGKRRTMKFINAATRSCSIVIYNSRMTGYYLQENNPPNFRGSARPAVAPAWPTGLDGPDFDIRRVIPTHMPINHRTKKRVNGFWRGVMMTSKKMDNKLFIVVSVFNARRKWGANLSRVSC